MSKKKLFLVIGLIFAVITALNIVNRQAVVNSIAVQKNSRNYVTKIKGDTGSGSGSLTLTAQSYPVFEIMPLAMSGNAVLSYGDKVPVFKFQVRSSGEGDIAIRKFSFDVNHSGINSGATGLLALESWKLYNLKSNAYLAIDSATLSYDNRVSFEFSDQLIVKSSSTLFQVTAHVYDDSKDNQNYLIVALSSDEHADVDADKKGIQLSGDFQELNSPQDNNRILWRENKDFSDLSEYRNGFGLATELGNL